MISKKKYLAALLFLIISPWFVQLLVSGFEWWWLKSLGFSLSNIWENLITNTSVDYLFLQGDSRVEFGTQETGPFYIYQIPLILIGFYALFDNFNLHKKILLGWLITAVLFAGCFTSPDFSNDLFYFLPLQIISFLGLLKIIDIWKRGKLLTKGILSAYALLAIYEMIIFFHIIIVHYPKRLLVM